MPQMAPISWLILFFIFSISFIMFNILNYYSMINQKNKSTELKTNKIDNKTLFWQW